MIPGKYLYVLALFCAVTLQSAYRAEATIFFAKQYGLPCSKCHDTVPKLKEFGSTFKNNGFSFDKKPAALPQHIAESVPVPVIPSSPSVAADTANNETSSQPAPSSPAEKVEYLFKWRSADGSHYFTDNPLRAQDNINEKPSRGRGAVTRVSRDKKTATRSVLPPVAAQTRVRRPPATVSSPDGPKKIAALPAPEVAKQLVPPPVPPPRTYEECMGELLMIAKTPTNSGEAMEQFERAEQSCAPSAAPH